ncbi:lipopolysaccharide transport periplasmic protein LptA [Serratia symbiotica str. 'Cinara cedri']|nr:lipopolysaccharide transport periplasmic protein LptA [Serratia symbiotica str. 'Cinara cedri']
MKFKIKKLICYLLITNTIFVISSPSMALKSDSNQPIAINSMKQLLDIQNNISIFTDNVIIKQGTINIRADKVVTFRSVGDKKKIYIKAFGDPVNLYQMQDNGKPIAGCAQQVQYEAPTQLFTLTGNAYLQELGNSIKGDSITYLAQQQKMQAFSNKGKHVTTILLPSQLKETNRQSKR